MYWDGEHWVDEAPRRPAKRSASRATAAPRYTTLRSVGLMGTTLVMFFGFIVPWSPLAAASAGRFFGFPEGRHEGRTYAFASPGTSPSVPAPPRSPRPARPPSPADPTTSRGSGNRPRATQRPRGGGTPPPRRRPCPRRRRRPTQAAQPTQPGPTPTPDPTPKPTPAPTPEADAQAHRRAAGRRRVLPRDHRVGLEQRVEVVALEVALHVDQEARAGRHPVHPRGHVLVQRREHHRPPRHGLEPDHHPRLPR